MLDSPKLQRRSGSAALAGTGRGVLMPKTADVKAGEVPVSENMELGNLHQLFAEETARWHPGGYEDHGDGGERRAPATSAPDPKPGRAP